MPEIQEAKCFKFTVQILPPSPLYLILYTPLLRFNLDIFIVATRISLPVCNFYTFNFLTYLLEGPSFIPPEPAPNPQDFMPVIYGCFEQNEYET